MILQGRQCTFASKSLSKAVILGTSVVTAEVTLLESAVLNAEEEVVSVVAVVIADLRLSTAITRPSDANSDPS